MTRKHLVRYFIVDHPVTALLIVIGFAALGYAGYRLVLSLLAALEI